MDAEKAALLKRRQETFKTDTHFQIQIDQLVEFIELMGITPAAEVLKEAAEYVPYLEEATKDFVVESSEEREWFAARMAYFIGEYFNQKYSGHWFVNDIPDSRFFAYYLVGKFMSGGLKPNAMVHAFGVAIDYVESAPPRKLRALLDEVDDALRNA